MYIHTSTNTSINKGVGRAARDTPATDTGRNAGKSFFPSFRIVNFEVISISEDLSMLQKQPVHVMQVHQGSLGREGSAFECAHVVDRAL